MVSQRYVYIHMSSWEEQQSTPHKTSFAWRVGHKSKAAGGSSVCREWQLSDGLWTVHSYCWLELSENSCTPQKGEIYVNLGNTSAGHMCWLLWLRHRYHHTPMSETQVPPYSHVWDTDTTILPCLRHRNHHTPMSDTQIPPYSHVWDTGTTILPCPRHRYKHTPMSKKCTISRQRRRGYSSKSLFLEIMTHHT